MDNHLILKSGILKEVLFDMSRADFKFFAGYILVFLFIAIFVVIFAGWWPLAIAVLSILAGLIVMCIVYGIIRLASSLLDKVYDKFFQ